MRGRPSRRGGWNERRRSGWHERGRMTRRWEGSPVRSRIGLMVSVMLLAAAAPGMAQWLKLPDKGIPRTKDGKPDLAAPAPRKADGKPELSGIWLAPGPKFLQNLAADLKPGD